MFDCKWLITFAGAAAGELIDGHGQIQEKEFASNGLHAECPSPSIALVRRRNVGQIGGDSYRETELFINLKIDCSASGRARV